MSDFGSNIWDQDLKIIRLFIINSEPKTSKKSNPETLSAKKFQDNGTKKAK